MKNIPFEKRTFPLGSERSIWEANVPFEKGTFPLWSERSLWEVDVPFEKGTFALEANVRFKSDPVGLPPDCRILLWV